MAFGLTSEANAHSKIREEGFSEFWDEIQEDEMGCTYGGSFEQRNTPACWGVRGRCWVGAG